MTSYIRRRNFMVLVGGAAVGWPLTVRAQQNNQMAALIDRILRLQAEAIAVRIGQFVEEIERQMGWMTQLPWSTGSIDRWRLDAARLLRQVPAITEVAQLDSAGREQALVSRVGQLAIGRQSDYSQHPKFVEAMASKHYYGPVYFRRQSEPYMTIAIAGARRDYGVVVAEVNLKFVWDVVRSTKVGDRGLAYVVDAQDQIIAHSDSGLIGRNVSALAHVKAARVAGVSTPSTGQVTHDSNGRDVLAASTPIAGLGWLAIVELPIGEAAALR
jgi:hypothetical protein